MKYSVTLIFNPDELLQTFADNQGICIQDVDLSVEEILEEELNWINSSGIYVLDLEEVKE